MSIESKTCTLQWMQLKSKLSKRYLRAGMCILCILFLFSINYFYVRPTTSTLNKSTLTHDSILNYDLSTKDSELFSNSVQKITKKDKFDFDVSKRHIIFISF